MEGIGWRPITHDDLAAVVALAAECHLADGGLAAMNEPDNLMSRYFPGESGTSIKPTIKREDKMKTNLVSLLLIVLMSSCAAPVAVSTPTPINTKTPTSTSTPIPTPTPTSTPTLTPTSTSIPVYTDLGNQANEIADLLGWTVVLCDETQTAEDLDHGIVLYREDTPEFFCDFEGHMPEPIPEVFPQFMLTLLEVKGKPQIGTDGYHLFLEESKSIYFASPSKLFAEEIYTVIGTFLDGFSFSIEEMRADEVHSISLRSWPLTTEEAELLLQQISTSGDKRHMMLP